MPEVLLALCAAWCMYWVVYAHDQLNKLLALQSGQSDREAAFLARHVNGPLPGGARPHGDALVRTPPSRELIPLVPRVDHRASPPLSAEPLFSGNVTSLDRWVADHG